MQSPDEAIRAQSAPPASMLSWRVQVAREQIGYLRFLLEGYEGLAQLCAVRGRDEVTLLVPASRAEECRALLTALVDELGLRPLATPSR